MPGQRGSGAARAVAVAVLAVGVLCGLAACAPQPGILLGGVGFGSSGPFDAADGTYHVHWTAHDEGATNHGCLVGLAIEQTRAAAPLDTRESRGPTEPKLIYRSIPAGARLVGDAAVYLDAGTYLVRSNGTCAWDAQIVPAGPDETPLNVVVDDGGNEQAG